MILVSIASPVDLSPNHNDKLQHRCWQHSVSHFHFSENLVRLCMNILIYHFGRFESHFDTNRAMNPHNHRNHKNVDTEIKVHQFLILSSIFPSPISCFPGNLHGSLRPLECISPNPFLWKLQQTLYPFQLLKLSHLRANFHPKPFQLF